jgi:hypothetical protein
VQPPGRLPSGLPCGEYARQGPFDVSVDAAILGHQPHRQERNLFAVFLNVMNRDDVFMRD